MLAPVAEEPQRRAPPSAALDASRSPPPTQGRGELRDRPRRDLHSTNHSHSHEPQGRGELRDQPRRTRTRPLTLGLPQLARPR
ncbi:hypothetical protein DF268_05145 [Streptomyces sp. V2]|nr:hypothetical protein DF268_05145 [Streptomyces sp. V2]